MKKNILFALLTLTLSISPSLLNAATPQQEIKEVHKLNSYDKKCANQDTKACETLINSLANMCQANNAFACFRLGEIATINSEVASIQGKAQDSVEWLDIALGTTNKACKLNIKEACKQMQVFKQNFQKACKKGDQFFCKAYKTIK